MPPKTLVMCNVIVVSMDHGQGYCIIMLHLLNTPNPRLRDNVDIIILWAAIETYGNLQATCMLQCPWLLNKQRLAANLMEQLTFTTLSKK